MPASVLSNAVADRTERQLFARRQATWSAAIIAVPAAVVVLLWALGLDTSHDRDVMSQTWITPQWRWAVIATCAACGAFLALVAWRAERRRRWIEATIRDADRRLEDPAAVASVLDGLRLGATWTADELWDAIDRWASQDPVMPSGLLLPSPITTPTLHDLAPIAGTDHFTDLLLLHAVAQSAVEPDGSGTYRRL